MKKKLMYIMACFALVSSLIVSENTYAFYDDFNDGNDDGWSIFNSSGNGSWDIFEGAMRYTCSETWPQCGQTPEILKLDNFILPENYQVSFDARIIDRFEPTGGSDHIGMWLHMADTYPPYDDDNLHTYIRQNEYNDVPLGGKINGTNLGEIGLVGKNALPLNDGGSFNMTDWHNFKVVKNGSVITAYIDYGQVYQETLSGSLSGGSLGIEVWNNGGGIFDIDNVNVSVVPEPISSLLFIVGGATLGFRRFRKKSKK